LRSEQLGAFDTVPKFAKRITDLPKQHSAVKSREAGYILDGNDLRPEFARNPHEFLE